MSEERPAGLWRSAGRGTMFPPMDHQDWNRRYAQKELVWTAEANRFLVAEASDLPPGRALDLAAGEGRNAVWLAERGWRVVAVDFPTSLWRKGRSSRAPAMSASISRLRICGVTSPR